MLYFPYQLNSCGSIEARHTSLPLHERNGYSAEGKGQPPKLPLPPGRGRWAVREYLPDCHIMWSAIIRCVSGCFPVAVNVEFLRIRGFFVDKFVFQRKEREK